MKQKLKYTIEEIYEHFNELENKIQERKKII